MRLKTRGWRLKWLGHYFRTLLQMVENCALQKKSKQYQQTKKDFECETHRLMPKSSSPFSYCLPEGSTLWPVPPSRNSQPGKAVRWKDCLHYDYVYTRMVNR